MSNVVGVGSLSFCCCCCCSQKCFCNCSFQICHKVLKMNEYNLRTIYDSSWTRMATLQSSCFGDEFISIWFLYIGIFFAVSSRVLYCLYTHTSGRNKTHAQRWAFSSLNCWISQASRNKLLNGNSRCIKLCCTAYVWEWTKIDFSTFVRVTLFLQHNRDLHGLLTPLPWKLARNHFHAASVVLQSCDRDKITVVE